MQENHYYPFGLNITTLEKQGVPEHKFQFMGVEKEDSFGLNWTETEWRGYDAQIGRFHQIDNLSEKYYDWAPYHYAGNDPITITDPTGEDWYVRVSIKPKYDSEGNFAGATFESSVLWADTHADEYVASDGLTYYKARSDGGLMVETSAYEDKGGYIYYDRDGNAEYGNRTEERNAAREAEGSSPGTIEHYPIIQEAIEWMMGLGEMKAGAKILKEVVSEGVEMSVKKGGKGLKRTKHVFNGHINRKKNPHKSKFKKPNQVEKLENRTIKKPDLVTQQSNGRIRYEKKFDRTISTDSEKRVMRVVVDPKKNKRITSFPAEKFKKDE